MPTQSQGPVLRTVPLSQVVVREGFNPRDDVERADLDRLTESVREHGLIQPLVVRPAEGGYELVDGERRYRACAQAAVTEVPVVVRETDADTEGLDGVPKGTDRGDRDARAATYGLGTGSSSATAVVRRLRPRNRGSPREA